MKTISGRRGSTGCATINAVRITIASVLLAAVAGGELRVVTYNISNYSGGRTRDLQNVIFRRFEGRSMTPDVIVCQEFLSQAAVNSFRNMLNDPNLLRDPNYDVGRANDWLAAPFIDGPDTDGALFYRGSKLVLDPNGVKIVSQGGPPPDPPRNTLRYTFTLKGYDPNAAGAKLVIYNAHFKAQDNGNNDYSDPNSDEARRVVEARRIREDARSLPIETPFLLAADLNTRRAAAVEYQVLVGSESDNRGRFFDPINSAGTWYENAAYALLHTQDPADSSGMDDRFDQILVREALIDGDGFDYVGDASIPYSTETWNDAHHTYRAWGNDGTSFNRRLTVQGNEMVGEIIAQAIINVAAGGGHIPVFLDLRVPPKIDSPTVVDFGRVQRGEPAEQPLTVINSGDVSLWGAAGIADLRYALSASEGFDAPSGEFFEPAGGGGNTHTITMDTSTEGQKHGTLTIACNAPEQPQRLVTLVGEVIAERVEGDVNGDGRVDQIDLAIVLASYGRCEGQQGYDGRADLDGDKCIGQGDLAIVLANYGR